MTLFRHCLILLITSQFKFSGAFDAVVVTRRSCYKNCHLYKGRALFRRSAHYMSAPRANSPQEPLNRSIGTPTLIEEGGPPTDGSPRGIVSVNVVVGQYDSPLVGDTEVINKGIEDNGTISLWMARAILLLVAVIWGTNFASVKYLENLCFHPPCNHPPSEAAFARFSVAGLVSLPFLIRQPTAIILAGFECGVWIAVGYFAQALALASISSSKAAFICSLTVVVVPLVSYLLYKKPVTGSNVISAVIALSGVAILEGLVDLPQILGIPAVTDTVDSSFTLIETVKGIAAAAPSTALGTATPIGESFLAAHKGDLLALGQPLGFGFAFMKIEEYVEKFKDVKNQVLIISSAQCVAVGLLSLLWVLFDFHGHIPNFAYMVEPHRIGAILWTGIVTTVLAINLQGMALQVASATEAAILFSSEPVWASIFGAWLLHEQLNINAYVGGAIILGACVFSAWKGQENEGSDHYLSE